DATRSFADTESFLGLGNDSVCSPVYRCPDGPPPMKWSDSKYGFAIEEDCKWRGRDTSLKRSLRSCGRLMLQRQVRDRFAKTRILGLQILQTLHLVRLQ